MTGGCRSPYLDWQAVADPQATEALAALLTPERMWRRWSGLSKPACVLHRHILTRYLETGEAPDSIAESRALTELRGRDLIFLEAGRIGAYPFAPSESGHRVTRGASSYQAVCVIDAFGIASMLDGPFSIETSCGSCGAEITFEVEGVRVRRCDLPDAVVWAAARDTGGCAATSQCRTMRAFCSVEHLKSWTRSEDGFVLSPAQAAQIGTAIFGPGSAFGKALANP